MLKLFRTTHERKHPAKIHGRLKSSETKATFGNTDSLFEQNITYLIIVCEDGIELLGSQLDTL